MQTRSSIHKSRSDPDLRKLRSVTQNNTMNILSLAVLAKDLEESHREVVKELVKCQKTVLQQAAEISLLRAHLRATNQHIAEIEDTTTAISPRSVMDFPQREIPIMQLRP